MTTYVRFDRPSSDLGIVPVRRLLAITSRLSSSTHRAFPKAGYLAEPHGMSIPKDGGVEQFIGTHVSEIKLPMVVGIEPDS
jgi:hypothetical protein